MTERMDEIKALSERIRRMEIDIETRELSIRAIRKERSELVTKRFKLQKREGLV